MSATPDSTLADGEQLVADLQRQLAECKAERDEALKQQTATAEVLQVINSSPGDLAPVFDAMLQRAMRLCEAAFGELQIYEDGRLRTVALNGVPPALADFRRGNPVLPAPGTVSGRLVEGMNVVRVDDLMAEQAYRTGAGQRRALVDLGGARSYLAVALRKDDRLLGAIGIYRQEVRPFSNKEITLLQNFAAQAVIAMENARLITETREALAQQTATAEVLQVINSSPGDPAPVFDAMLEKAMRLCDGIQGALWTIDGGRGRVEAAQGLPAEFVVAVNASAAAGTNPMLQRVIRGERVIQIRDVTEHDVYRSAGPIAKAAIATGVRTLIWVALVRDGAPVGAFTIARRAVRPFTDQEIALLQNFAAQAVIAMENARLISETRHALERQTATAEILGVINSSPADLRPVFETMLEKAMELCAAAFGVLWTYDGEDIRAVAHRGVPPAFAEFIAKGPHRADTDLLTLRLLEGAGHVAIADIPAGEAYRRGYPFPRALVDLGGGRSLLSVPLRKDDALSGFIVMYWQEVRSFEEKQIALLQNFAAQAVIAMENARLLGELRQRTEEVSELNRGLEARVAEQVDELGRIGRLKRFLAPQLAELIVSQGDEKILESHRREIVVVFCDLRGYTAFTETAEPEEVLDFLREYHGALGPLVSRFEGTLDQFSGDGIMVFFNDPVPCPDPAERAVKMAIAMREAAGTLIAAWRRHGCELGFGAGIAQGYATLGQIGFSERSGYTAIGTVCNLAARLCAEAKDGQILVSSRIAGAVEAVARLEDLGNLALKGLRRPVAAFNVVQCTSAAEARPNLTVVARGPRG
jgi:adenylate cyclase